MFREELSIPHSHGLRSVELKDKLCLEAVLSEQWVSFKRLEHCSLAQSTSS